MKFLFHRLRTDTQKNKQYSLSFFKYISFCCRRPLIKSDPISPLLTECIHNKAFESPLAPLFQRRKANSNPISSVTVHTKMTARRQVRCGRTKGAERRKRYRWWEQIETKWRVICSWKMLREMSKWPVARILQTKGISSCGVFDDDHRELKMKVLHLLRAV